MTLPSRGSEENDIPERSGPAGPAQAPMPALRSSEPTSVSSLTLGRIHGSQPDVSEQSLGQRAACNTRLPPRRRTRSHSSATIATQAYSVTATNRLKRTANAW